MKRLLLIFILFITGCSNPSETIPSPTSTPYPSSSPIVEDKVENVSMIMFGDALIHGSVYRDSLINENGYKDMFDELADDIANADIAYYNQETLIGCADMPHSPYPLFNTPQSFGDDMVDLGFNLVSLANNHSYDMGERGLLCSIDYWDSKGIEYAGIYDSQHARDNEQIFEVDGIKFAMLAYTYGTNGIEVPNDKSYYVNIISDDLMLSDINKLRDNVDILIVAMHFGTEYSHVQNAEQVRIATLLADNGVDLIIGTHPHVIQPTEWIGDTLVIYSLGNMLSAQIGQERLTGGVVSLEFEQINDGQTIIKNVDSELIYTYYDDGYKDFKLYYYEDKNENIIPNYYDTKAKFEAILNN